MTKKEFTFHQIPVELSFAQRGIVRNYDFAEELQKSIINNIYQYRSAVSSMLTPKINQLIKKVQRCNSSWIFSTNSSTINSYVDEFNNELDEYYKIETFMDQVATEHLNIFQLYPVHMKILYQDKFNRPSPAIYERLEEVEKKYYGNF